MKTFKWNEEQLTALNGSIRKWARIVNGSLKDEGSENCPCCKKWIKEDCRGCPIKAFTGQGGCLGTPYEFIDNEFIIEDSEKFIDSAQQELNFLKAVYLAGGGK